MATAVAQPKMTWELLAASREWQDLSAPRKVWLTKFLANGGNALDATRTAYPDVSERSLHTMASQLKGNRAILAALELYNGGVTRELLINEVRLGIRFAETGSVAHSRLLAQLERLVLGGQDEGSEPVPVAVKPQIIPSDALEVWSDPKTGVAIGYRAANGVAVKL